MGEVFNRSELTPYIKTPGYSSRLIPLHRWNYIDEYKRERGKSPAHRDWREKQYTSGELKNALKEGQNLGIRLTCEDLVIDIDPRNMMGMDVDTVKSLLELDFGLDVWNAPTVITGSGGQHLYFHIPEGLRGFKTVNELKKEYPGVEWKVLGRQVVAAGSKHPNGEHYEWAETYETLQFPEVTPDLMNAIRRPDNQHNNDIGEIEPGQFKKLINALDVEDFQDHDKWLELMMACHSATGGAGVSDFVEWCVQDPQYSNDGGAIENRWYSLDSDAVGGVTAATLYMRVREAGGDELLREDPSIIFGEVDIPEIIETPRFDRDENTGRPKPTIENCLRAITAMRVSPEYDELHDAVCLRGHLGPIQAFFPIAEEVWDDRLLHAARHYILNTWRMEVHLRMLNEAFHAVALQSPFNPIKEYLDSLSWDGTSRLREWMTMYCGTEPDAYCQAVSQLMIVSAVGRAYKPGIKYDTMIVLEGQQGCGKSSMLKILGGPWTLEGLPAKNPNDKDVIQAMQGNWIVEIEEMATMRQAEVDSLKAFLSRMTDRARFAYAQNTRDYKRRVVFIGTTNDSQYLTDSTGNRRFLPVRVGLIDLEGLQNIRDQLFAEAVQVWKAAPRFETLMLDKKLWERAREEQESRRIVDPFADAVDDFLYVNRRVEFFTVNEVTFGALQRSSKDLPPNESKRITKLMSANPHWRRARRNHKGHTSRGYERTGLAYIERK